MIELRGVETRFDDVDWIVSAIVSVDYPDVYKKHELYRNKPVNRGRILKHLAELYNVEPGSIVWPRHVKVD